MKAQRTVVSLFSGCGGSSLGYKMAGAKVLFACDFDQRAADSYALNFPDTQFFCGDVTQLDVKDIPLQADLDILDGSPPCQGFSMLGDRNPDDQKNQLFKQYVRILKALKPKAFVMENVAAMAAGAMLPIFLDAIAELRQCGYEVKARVLNASWYGVPQSRNRMIFIGFRCGMKVYPSHPRPTVKAPVTCFKAIGSLINSDAPKLTAWQAGFWHRCKPGNSFKSVSKNGKNFGFYKLSATKPAPTIDTHCVSHIYHYSRPRRLSTLELMRLSSFPDDFKWAHGHADAGKRMGNSVPPKFMAAIAQHVMAELDRAEGVMA